MWGGSDLRTSNSRRRDGEMRVRGQQPKRFEDQIVPRNQSTKADVCNNAIETKGTERLSLLATQARGTPAG